MLSRRAVFTLPLVFLGREEPRLWVVYDKDGYRESDWITRELADRRRKVIHGKMVLGRPTYDRLGLQPEEV